jgi:hypothetical protein
MQCGQTHAHPKWLGIVFFVLGGIALAVVLGFLFGAVVMWLWNWLMPGLFGLKVITYWQGVGLVILARLLFGSFGHGKHAINAHHQRHVHGRRGNFKVWWQAEGQQAFDTYVARKSPQAGGEEEAPQAD